MILRTLILLLLAHSVIHAQHEWQKPKPLIPKDRLDKIIGTLTTMEPSKPLNIVWVWGYDGGHRPGAHDYLRVRDLMTGMLKKVPTVTVDTVYLFPSKAQFAEADLVAMYLHLPQLTAEQYADFNTYIRRGGGVVALHETAIIRPAAEGKKLAECLGMAWDEGRSEWGAIFEDIAIENDHEIFNGFPDKLRIVDEFYWHLNQVEGVKILGTVRTGPPRSSRGLLPTEMLSKEPSPMFWTLKSGNGRVFGTTTGHNTFTYYDPEFRIVVFRAIAWALKEKPDPFMPLVFDGITDAVGNVGTTDMMRDWVGKLRGPPKE
ncbi:MAG: type 1 glutamine amidotransferase [Verrucomicrobiales bacterium]|jgi:type 1 glutamine amidotransferase